MDGAASIGGVRSGTASFTTPTASISPAKASGANAPDRSQRIDHQPPTLAQIYCQQSARQPGDIISERRATSSRNQRATSSESACDGHNVAFGFFGGVPKSILYDIRSWRWPASWAMG